MNNLDEECKEEEFFHVELAVHAYVCSVLM